MITLDERAILKAVCDAPDDDFPRMAYADWCEENGRPRRAEFVRIQLMMAKGAEGCSCGACVRRRGGGQQTNGPCAMSQVRIPIGGKMKRADWRCQQENDCALVALLVANRAALWSDEKVYPREKGTEPTLSRCGFLFSVSTSARTVWRAVQTRQVVVDSMISAAKAASGPQADFYRYGRWLVLSLVFLRLRPHQGNELFLGADLAKISAECIDYAEKMWSVALETGLVSRKVVSGTVVYEAPTEFKVVFGDPNECQRLRAGAMKKLNEKPVRPAAGGVTEGAKL